MTNSDTGTPAAGTLGSEELDDVYSLLCATMTRVGETQATLFLGRFALLAMLRIGDAAQIRALIGDAADGL